MTITATYDVSYEKRKKIVKTAMIAIIICVVIFATLAIAHADDYDNSFRNWYNGQVDDVGEELTDGPIDHVGRIFMVGISSRYTRSSSMLAGAILDAKAALYASLDPIQQVALVIAVFMILVTSSVHLIQELQRGDGTLEMWAKVSVICIVGLLIVYNCSRIVSTVEYLGQWLYVKVYATVKDVARPNSLNSWLEESFRWVPYDDAYKVNYRDIYTGAWYVFPADLSGFIMHMENILIYIKVIFKLVTLYAMYFVLQFIMLGADITLMSMWIEIFLRKCFMPLGIAAIVGEGARSPGVLYLKKFFAIYIRIAMCFVIAAMTSILAGAVLNQTPASFVQGLVRLLLVALAYLTCSRLYAQTSTLASQVIGA